MSSEIGSRPIDWSLYNVVFAGFQKNLGSAGGGIVIVRREAIKEQKNVPSLMNYNNLNRKTIYVEHPTSLCCLLLFTHAAMDGSFRWYCPF